MRFWFCFCGSKGVIGRTLLLMSIQMMGPRECFGTLNNKYLWGRRKIFYGIKCMFGSKIKFGFVYIDFN